MLYMVEINPVNETIKIAANALFIRNEFLKIPITSRQQFVITCREHNHFFKDWQKISLAERFWNGRLYREDVNEHMEMVLDNFRESVKTLKMAQDGVY